jgi:hypothetical protein
MPFRSLLRGRRGAQWQYGEHLDGPLVVRVFYDPNGGTGIRGDRNLAAYAPKGFALDDDRDVLSLQKAFNQVSVCRILHDIDSFHVLPHIRTRITVS